MPIIRESRLSVEQHMIIKQLNKLLLAKGGLYTIDVCTMSNIDTFIR